MVVRRLISAAVLAAAQCAPLSALAQGAGSVTTAPVQGAPALALPLLMLLAAALAVVGVRRTSRRGTRAAAAGGVLVLLLLAGVCYGPAASVIISDAKCLRETTSPYDSTLFTILINSCPGLIRIVAIDPSCADTDCRSDTAGVPSAQCTVGQTLSSSETCNLPSCCPI